VAHDARAISNALLERADARGRPLTHLSLQKILFFAHGWYLAKHNRPFIGQPFEAWRYGPVNRVVYDQLKVFKDRPIQIRLLKVDASTGEFRAVAAELSDQDQNFLENIHDYYSEFDAGKLVDLTHETGGPWQKVWIMASERAVVGMHIPDDAIRYWFLREGGRVSSFRH
jgi:uncharacterized phage-associated protein